MVEVTKEDRDAAADAVKAYRDQKNGNWQDRIRRGECDDGYMVQAFARHREAARIAAIEEAAEVVAIADAGRDTLSSVRVNFRRRIKSRILALKGTDR